MDQIHQLRLSKLDSLNMLLSSGNIFRSFAEQVSFSFNCDYLFKDNLSGASSIYVSGDDASCVLFSFVSGRVFDCHGRFVRSYSPFEALELSGNFCSGNFGYYINNVPICLSSKLSSDSSSFDGFIFSTSGCPVEFSLNVFGQSKPLYELEFLGNNIISGSPITGLLKNISHDSFQSFKVFSASSFFPTYGYSLSSDMSGVKIKPGDSAEVVLSFLDRGEFSEYASSDGTFALNGDLTFNTNFGAINIPVGITLNSST
jgi:hypothetical protein